MQRRSAGPVRVNDTSSIERGAGAASCESALSRMRDLVRAPTLTRKPSRRHIPVPQPTIDIEIYGDSQNYSIDVVTESGEYCGASIDIAENIE